MTTKPDSVKMNENKENILWHPGNNIWQQQIKWTSLAKFLKLEDRKANPYIILNFRNVRPGHTPITINAALLLTVLEDRSQFCRETILDLAEDSFNGFG